MEIPFQGQFDRATFFRGVALAHQTSRRETVIRFGLAGLFLLIYGVYFVLVAGKEDLTTFDLFRTGRHLLALPVVGFVILQPYLNAYWAAFQIWRTPTTRAPVRGLVSSQGLTYLSTHSRRDIAWGQFVRRRGTDALLSLLTADGTLAVLPRSFFQNEAHWQTVQQWAAHHIIEAR